MKKKNKRTPEQQRKLREKRRTNRLNKNKVRDEFLKKEALKKARMEQKNKKNGGVFVGFDSGDEMQQYFEELREQNKKEAVAVVNSMNPSNIDMTILEKPDYESKHHNVNGKKFQMNMWCGEDKKPVKVLSQKPMISGKTRKLMSVVQLWSGYKSVLLCMTKNEMEDARKDWRGDKVIPKNDLISQTLSYLGLNSRSNTQLYFCKEVASEDYDGFSNVWSVWD